MAFCFRNCISEATLVVRRGFSGIITAGCNKNLKQRVNNRTIHREHAAIVPRYLELHAVIAKSFARIHMQNLANFGILPLTFVNPEDWEDIEQGDILEIENLQSALPRSIALIVSNRSKNHAYKANHSMIDRQAEIILGGLMAITAARWFQISSAPNSK
jgi:hypothetical protein